MDSRRLRIAMIAGIGLWPTSAKVLPAQMTPRSRCGTPLTGACEDRGDLRFVAISAGHTHTCALTRDGTAWCWGDGRKGSLGDGSILVHRWPQRVDTPARFIEIGAGGDFTCGRTREGAIYCWGTERPVPGWPNVARAPVKVVTSIAATALTAGRRHACVLDAESRASCWGFNVDAETGTGSAGLDAPMIPSPTPVAGNHTFRSLSAGSGFTCGLTTDAAVFCWGSNVDGSVGESAKDRCGDVASVACSLTPVSVPLDGKVLGVSAGTSHACAVTDEGAVLCWGSNASGQFGFVDPKTPIIRSPKRIEFERGTKMRSVHAGGVQSCATSDREQLFCWGADSKSLTNLAHWAHELRPRLVGDRFHAVTAGQSHYCVIDRSGRARCWGESILGALGPR